MTEGEPTVSSDGITLTKNGKTMYLSTIATGTTIRYRQWSSDPSDYSSPLSAYDEANPGTYIVGFEATVSKGRNAIFRVTLSPDKQHLKQNVMHHSYCLRLSPPLMAAGCNKPENGDDNGGQGETPVIGLTVTGIENNCATISVSMTSGTAASARIVENLPLSEVQFDYENEIQLVNYVKENGTEISLPYTNTLEDLKNGTDFLTAVIALDGNGTATYSASHIWTAVGKEEAWSEDGNTGDLGEVEW